MTGHQVLVQLRAPLLGHHQDHFRDHTLRQPIAVHIRYLPINFFPVFCVPTSNINPQLNPKPYHNTAKQLPDGRIRVLGQVNTGEQCQ